VNVFAFLAIISLGLLQIIALKYSELIWEKYEGFIRTRSREIPSERTVKSVISNLLVINYRSFAPNGILGKIRKIYLRE
jgi:hypothetical protein